MSVNLDNGLFLADAFHEKVCDQVRRPSYGIPCPLTLVMRNWNDTTHSEDRSLAIVSSPAQQKCDRLQAIAWKEMSLKNLVLSFCHAD